MLRSKKSLVLNSKEGHKERVAILEEQLVEMATTAAKAVDRAESLEQELKTLKKSNSSVSFNSDRSSVSRFSMGHASKASTATTATTATVDSVCSNWREKGSIAVAEPPKSFELLLEENHKISRELRLERLMRKDSEQREQALSSQIEDLSQSLFEDANNRVAAANKKAALMEMQLMQRNETHAAKDDRLHRLEVALRAIHHARRVLNSRQMNSYI